MKIALTGATGLLGRYIVSHFAGRELHFSFHLQVATSAGI
jgi:uncharacterized protein YbjT (DUF2867 family)